MASPRAQLAAAVRNGLLRPGPDDTYADGDDATWMDVDWPRCSGRWSCWGGGSTCSTRAGGGGGTPLRLHPRLGLELAELAAEHPGLHGAPPRASRSTCPASAGRRCPRSRSRSRATRGSSTSCATSSASSASAVVGNSMGGFVGAELALAFPTRVERLVLVSAAGLSLDRACPARRVLASGADASRSARRGSRRARAARSRAAAAAAGRAAWRRALPAEALGAARRTSSCSAPGKPGFVPALDALTSYSFRDRLRRDRDPGADRVGRERHARARRATRRASSG